MSDEKDVHELAGGWISERKNTKVPAFLKLSYLGFCLFGFAYLFQYWKGELAHESRGPLVQQVNTIMQVPGFGFQATIAAILVAFVLGLLWFAFVHRAEE